MKIILAFLYILTACNISNAQTASLEWGETIKFPKDLIWISHIGGNSESQFVLIKSSQYPQIFTLLNVDKKNLKVNSSKEIMNDSIRTALGKVLYFEGISYVKGRLILYLSSFDKDASTNSLYVQELSENGNFIGALKSIAVINDCTDKERGAFSINLSNDSSLFLVSGIPPMSTRKNDEFYFTTFDLNFDIRDNKKISIPYPDRLFRAMQFAFSGNGTIYILGKVNVEREVKLKGNAEYYMEVIAVLPGGTLKHYDLHMDKKEVLYCTMSLTRLGKLKCVGLYADVESFDMDGYFYMQIDDMTKEVRAQKSARFSNEFLSKVYGKPRFGDELGIKKTFYLNGTLSNENSLTMLLEDSKNYYSSEFEMFNPNSLYRSERFDVILFKLNEAGEEETVTCVRKDQEFTYRSLWYRSYGLFQGNKNIYLFYHENPKNLEKKDNNQKEISNVKKSVLTLFVCKDGEYSKIPVEYNEVKSEYLVPTFSRDLSNNNEVFVLGYSLNKTVLKFGKLSVQ